MDDDIYDALESYFRNIKIEVLFDEIRHYKINFVVGRAMFTYIYKYDVKKTFKANIDSIVKEMESCILKYYRKSETL